MAAIRNTPFANISYQADTSTGNDKTLTVPANHQWRINSINVNVTCSSITGSRAVTVQGLDTSTNELWRYNTAPATLSSASTGTILWAPGHVNDTAFGAGLLLRTISGELIVHENERVRIFDSTAVSTLDAFRVRLQVEDRAV